MTKKLLKKYLLIIAGSIALLLGIIGIFVPVLPTTPFLILTSYCYLRSSKRLYEWLINNRVFGKYIYNYVHYGAVKKSTKIGAIIFLWCSLGISFYLVQLLFVRILLVGVGIGVSIHLLKLKTLKQEDIS